MGEIAAQEGGREAPDERHAGDLVDEAREPLERQLRLPGGGQRAAERRVELRPVALEVRSPPGEHVERGLGGQPRADERLVHPVPRERVDEPGRVADEQHPSADGPVARAAHRQPVAAQVVELAGRKAVRRTGALEMLPQARPFRLPAADADVHVVALRKHPGVAARDGAEIDDREPSPAFLARVCIRDVPLERDAESLRREAQRPRGDAVDAVRADRDRRAGRGSVEADDRAVVRPARARSPAAPSRKSAPAAAACSARCASSLRRCVIRTSGPSPAPLEPLPVAEAELEAVDDVLDDRVDGDGQLPHGAVGQAAAARLVAREALAVEQQHLRAPLGEAVGGRRAGRAGPDDDRVEPLHGVNRTSLEAAQGRQ